jgi:hypothetical protein
MAVIPSGSRRARSPQANRKRAVKELARKGYLGFQDHGHPVWYKNVKLLPLK